MLRLSIISLLFVGLAAPALAQQLEFEPPPSVISPAQQLLLEQVEQSISLGETDEAIRGLTELANRLSSPAYPMGLKQDEPPGEVVQVGAPQRAGTLTTRRYIPLGEWLRHKIRSTLSATGGSEQPYRENLAEASGRAFDNARSHGELPTLVENAERFAEAQGGWQHELLLADAFLERGWTVAALQAMHRAVPELRFPLNQIDAQAEGKYQSSGSLAWYLVQGYSQNTANLPETILTAIDTTAATLLRPDGPGAEHVARRLLLAAEMTPDVLAPTATRAWLKVLASRLEIQDKDSAGGIERLLIDTTLHRHSPSLPGTPPEASNPSQQDWQFDTSWPSWTQTLERYASSGDPNPASRPRVGELERGSLCYRVNVYDGKIFLNELTRIGAYEIDSGRTWPASTSPQGFYDGQIAAGKYLPLAFPLLGVPRGTVAIQAGCLYARMGSPVTGWGGDTPQLGSVSRSYLVGFDLAQPTVMLPGFPLRLRAPDFPRCEFEGPPLVFGDRLIVAIAQRDNVGLQRSVAAFDRFSGDLVWRSSVLARGVVAGTDRAHQIANQSLTQAGGRLLYNTNLGSIVCLDPQTGRTQWLTQYSRPDRQRQVYPSPDRYLYRDSTPCLVAGGMVYCMPADCPEVFALDVTSGDLVWATDDTDVPDAIHLLGVAGDQLLVSGDHLVWLDSKRGRVLAKFPGSTTPGVLNALPSPRGLGRGTLAGSQVLFPVAGEILVFEAVATNPPPSPGLTIPPIVSRLRLDSRGSEGVNLQVHGPHLIATSPSRLMVFPKDTNSP